jgi:hypothetical protein
MASMHPVHADADEHDESVHHEGSDIDIRAIGVSAVALFLMTAFCYAVVFGAFKFFESQHNDASAVRQYPLAKGQEDRLPPEPRLQTNPKQELIDLRSGEALVLDNYQWVDKTGGVVRIPIAEAMKLTVQRGLASRPANAPGAQTTSPAPTAATPAAAPAAAEHAR